MKATRIPDGNYVVKIPARRAGKTSGLGKSLARVLHEQEIEIFIHTGNDERGREQARAGILRTDKSE